MSTSNLSAALAAATVLSLLGCEAAPPEPSTHTTPPAQQPVVTSQSRQPTPPPQAAPEAAATPPKRKVSARPVASVPPSPKDPQHGTWTLEDATKGLPAGKQLAATIETSMGALDCKLFDDKAPITVANFIGLARGIRPWETSPDTWEKRPYYNGSVFHRIVRGFMIQGGDHLKSGVGGPGYVIPDEIWENAYHDRPGLLCTANRGPNTNGSQFFITDGAAAHLDNNYTIFGECGPIDLVHALASVEVYGERPKSPPEIRKITISRKP